MRRFLPLALAALLPSTAAALEASYDEPKEPVPLEHMFEGGYVTELIVDPDGSLVHADLAGSVKRFDAATGRNTLLFEVDTIVGPEWGLTGLARDEEGAFYTMYTWGAPGTDPEDNAVSGELRVTRWVDGEEASVFVTEATRSHNGGRLLWHNGTLFVTLGEHTRGVEPLEKRMAAQDPGRLAGKVLRMLRDGSPAPGNPAESDDRFHPLVYSYGHRNPFGIDWDSRRGVIVISDPAADHNEEVSHVPKGANLGWPLCVGPCATPDPALVDPIVLYPETITPVGLEVVGRDYYVGSYNLGQVRRVFETKAGWTDEVVALTRGGVLGLAVSPDEKWIYVGTWNGTWRMPTPAVSLALEAELPDGPARGLAGAANGTPGFSFIALVVAVALAGAAVASSNPRQRRRGR